MDITFKLSPTEYAEAQDILADLVKRVQAKPEKVEAAPDAQTPPAAPTNPAPVTPQAPASAETSQQTSVPTAMPTSTPVFTQEQLALAATQLMDAGKQAELIKVLQDMGVPSLANLDPSRYSDFAARIRSLGAKI